MFRRFLWIYLRCSGYSNVDCLVCEVFETFQNFELKARFISQCVPDNTVVDKSPWDVDEMQWIIFATKFKNALLFPMHAMLKIKRKLQLLVFSAALYVGHEERLDRWSCIRMRANVPKVQICPKTCLSMIVAVQRFRVVSLGVSQDSELL